MPKPDGSSWPRRWLCAPASVHEPAYSQFPDMVVPSSLSHAKPGNCWPDLISWPVLGSCRSARALPLISLAISVNVGDLGFTYCQLKFTMASGNLVLGSFFSFWYSSLTLTKMLARISWSSLASPGGSSALYFHLSQRAELTKVPSFSAKPAPGNR